MHNKLFFQIDGKDADYVYVYELSALLSKKRGSPAFTHVATLMVDDLEALLGPDVLRQATAQPGRMNAVEYTLEVIT